MSGLYDNVNVGRPQNNAHGMSSFIKRPSTSSKQSAAFGINGRAKKVKNNKSLMNYGIPYIQRSNIMLYPQYKLTKFVPSKPSEPKLTICQ